MDMLRVVMDQGCLDSSRCHVEAFRQARESAQGETARSGRDIRRSAVSGKAATLGITCDNDSALQPELPNAR